jgi:hypothetical protein
MTDLSFRVKASPSRWRWEGGSADRWHILHSLAPLPLHHAVRQRLFTLTLTDDGHVVFGDCDLTCCLTGALFSGRRRRPSRRRWPRARQVRRESNKYAQNTSYTSLSHTQTTMIHSASLPLTLATSSSATSVPAISPVASPAPSYSPSTLGETLSSFPSQTTAGRASSSGVRVHTQHKLHLTHTRTRTHNASYTHKTTIHRLKKQYENSHSQTYSYIPHQRRTTISRRCEICKRKRAI